MTGDESDLIDALERLDALVGPPEAPYAVVLVRFAGEDRSIERVSRQLARSLDGCEHSVYRVGLSELAVLTTTTAERSASQIARTVTRDLRGWRRAEDDVVVTFRAAWDERGDNARRGVKLWWTVKEMAITDRTRETEQRLRHVERLAMTDASTGALNRRGLDQVVNLTAGAFAVAFIDVDDLRAFNATPLGWAAGDAAIGMIVDAVRRQRPFDHLARWGGDEFVLISPGATPAAITDALSTAWVELVTGSRVEGLVPSFSFGVAWATTTGFSDALLDAQRRAKRDKRAKRR